MQSALSWAAFFFYAGATFAAFGYLFSKDERASRLMLGLLGVGLLLHLLAFGAHLAAFWSFPENRFLMPVSSFYGALSYMALALTAAFFVVEAKNRLGILGAFVLPWAALSLGAAVAFAEPSSAPLAQPLRSYWLNLHPMLLMTAYAAFANACGVAVALLVQERQLKSRKPGELMYRLPPIDELDELNARIIAWAYPFLLGGLLMGFVWAGYAWEQIWTWEPKLALSVITAVLYAGFLWSRYVASRRGRRTVYLSLAGFASVVFTFLGAEIIGHGRALLGGP